jgi:uncharacterized protein YukE
VTGGGYEVTAAELVDMAREYKARAEAIGQALARFRAGASLPDSAFGNLPESRHLALQYQDFCSRVTQDATKVSDGLVAGAVKLAQTAVTYRAADQVVAAYLNNLRQSGQRTGAAEPEQGR